MGKIHVLKCNLQKLFYLIILNGKTSTYYIIRDGERGVEAMVEGFNSLLLCTCYLKCERKSRIRTIEHQNFSIFPNLFHFPGWIQNKNIVFPLKLSFKIYIFPKLLHSFATPSTPVFGWELFPRTSTLFICFTFRGGAGEVGAGFWLVPSSVFSPPEFRLYHEWKCENLLHFWPARQTIAIAERFSHNSETMYKCRKNFPVNFLCRILCITRKNRIYKSELEWTLIKLR